MGADVPLQIRRRRLRTNGMSERKTQLERIVEVLEREGRIDNFYCIHTQLSLRLGARIYDLRQLGWEFDVEELPSKNTVYKMTKRPAPRPLTLFS